MRLELVLDLAEGARSGVFDLVPLCRVSSAYERKQAAPSEVFQLDAARSSPCADQLRPQGPDESGGFASRWTGTREGQRRKETP